MMFDLRPGQGGSHRAKFNCGSKGSEMVRAGVFQEDVGPASYSQRKAEQMCGTNSMRMSKKNMNEERKGTDKPAQRILTFL